MIAYDLETTKIEKGTPRPLYITAFGAAFQYSGKVDSVVHLRDILQSQFLTLENNGARFIAWNGNNFDAFLISAALLHSPDYVLRPYLTRSKALRGIRITHKEKTPDGKKQEWEFLDGMAMIVGNAAVSLKKFLETFAPDYHKLEGPDFEKETFDAKNPAHVAYAERDSEGLYHGLVKAESIVWESMGQRLQPTIGNLGIRTFQAHIPEGINCWSPPFELEQIIRKHVMRGGFCFLSRKYEGPIWKYDINQAYAAAMREAQLPAGRAIKSKRYNPYAHCAVYLVSCPMPGNRVPFYVRDESGRQQFALESLDRVWITSIEYRQLLAEGRFPVVHDAWFWDDSFSMKEYVDKLEGLRGADPHGPNGAQGTMMKAIGNNSYGKTVETLNGLELVMALNCPDGFSSYQNPEEDLQHVWCKVDKPHVREYHQPQIGAFITAQVRMVLRRAILMSPKEWLYSDTDCCFFSKPVNLPIDKKRYGKWKIEAEGEEYTLTAKKVYASFASKIDKDGRIVPKEAKAKGMSVKRLSLDDFSNWYLGKPPTQRQVQRQNFVAVMTGADMYIERVKVGQRIKENRDG